MWNNIGIESQPGGQVRQPIWRTGPPGYIGWRNRFLGIDSLGSLNVCKFGLCTPGNPCCLSQYVSLLKTDKINNLTGRSGSNSCCLRKDLKPFFMTLASDGTRRILYKVLSHFHEFCKKLRQYPVPPQNSREPTLILCTSILPRFLIQIYL